MRKEVIGPLPNLVGEFHDRLGKSFFQSLGEPLMSLAATRGETYLHDFEAHLALLRDAFPDKPWPAWAVNGFVGLNKQILREEAGFRETGRYSASPEDLERVTEEVYHNGDVMDRYYLVGLYSTYFLWPHHARIMDFYRQEFLGADGAPPNTLAEWGVGHGLFTLEAIRRWPGVKTALVDLSAHSLSFSEQLLRTAGCWINCSSQQADVVTASDLNPADRLICSELLEHVPNPGKLLDRVREYLHPGGMAFLTGAINAPQPDHVFLFTEDRQLFDLVAEHGLSVRTHMSACHPARQADIAPPTVLAMVVEHRS